MTNKPNQENIGSRTNNIWSRGKIIVIGVVAAGAIVAGYALIKNLNNSEGCTYLGRGYPSWQARIEGEGNNWYDPTKDYRSQAPSTPEGFRRLPNRLQGKCERAISYKTFQ